MKTLLLIRHSSKLTCIKLNSEFSEGFITNKFSTIRVILSLMVLKEQLLLTSRSRCSLWDFCVETREKEIKLK
jgi:hypothetical protein